MESQDLDKLFRDAFEHAEETPNNRVWENIEQELAQEKKRVPFYIKYRAQLSIAATLLLFFGIGLTFYKQPIPTGKEKIEEVLTVIEQNKNYPNKNSENIIIEKTSPSTESETIISNNEKIITGSHKQTTSNNYNNQSITVQPVEETYNIEDKREIVEQDQILSTVDIDLTINRPQYKNIQTIEPKNKEIQTSYAFNTPKEEVKSSIVTRVLNGIAKNVLSKSIDIQENKEIEFKNDDEGSITLNIFNSLAKK